MDLALWLRYGPRDPPEEVNSVEVIPQLQGAMLAHVDDLLFTGNAEVEESLKRLEIDLVLEVWKKLPLPGAGNASSRIR